MPTKRVVIVPYNIGSASVKGLVQNLKARLKLPIIRVRKDSVKYQPRWTDYVINWGCSQEWPWINLTDKVGNAISVNKLSFFEMVAKWNAVQPKTVNVPEWTTEQAVAAQWVKDGHTVVGRKLLTGNSGKGIVLYEGENAHVQHCPLYTKYKKKKHEYRVHVFNGKVIDVAQKKKRKGIDNIDTKIRNCNGGWVFCREGIEIPNGLLDQAVLALAATGLKFGAVDVIWNAYEDKCYVLEVNTAPGIEGTTLEKYTNAFVQDILK